MLAIWRVWKSSKHCSGVNDMAEQHEKALVPQIRFTGFTDPWEQRKLGELASKRIEKNTNGIKETFTNSAEHGVVSQLDYFDHDITNDANIGNYSVVHPDDFIYNPRISAVAPCGPINRNKLDRNGVMSPLYTVFSVDDTIDKLYLEHYFKTSRWHQFMFLEGNSGARSDRFSISDSIFFEMPIQCPVLEEQELIASFFGRLDSLITLHQRKYDKLCVLKKSMLDKMFPKGGSLYPEIRFAGFTDPWEQRKLGQHLKLSRELGHTGVDARKLTVKLWGKGVVEKTDLYGGSAQTQYYIRHAGQFMYGKLDFLHAAFGVVPDKLDCFESTLDSPAFDIEGLDSSFLLNLVTQEDFYLKNGNIANGSRKAKRIHEETFLNMEIRAPELVEQRRIGAFLDRLDSLITLHQRKLELLRNIKKSMLDEMFV
ncbi:restriction endonuclease subunit S [Bifidobacterium adolescentis]|nr:restriction endonuclease subunit S [Bifidobacterium adolescentis]KAB5662376.1 restriction endonuclease subunit S [Bifidobacterium adolescentis]KAB5722689.1 restriction endonuclease subunit S [Bifidobacterium adolescentis]